MSVIAFCKNETSSTPLHVCLHALQDDDYASGKREGAGGREEKLFALVVPKFHKVCAEARALSGLKTR